MVHGSFWGSIQVRRTSRGRLYHWAIANDRGTAKLLSFELHTGCAIYAKLVSTQVRVPPGARNFYRRKFIYFFPFLLSVFVSVETSTLSSSTRALPRDKEESLSLTEYQWGLLHWAFEFLRSSINLIISFAISVSPNGGRTCHHWFPRSRAQPLGHSDSWKFGVLTQLYIGNPLSKLRKSE